MLDAAVIVGRSRGIDSLRALFALSVLFVHAVPWATFVQGGAAVPAAATASFRFLVDQFQSSGETNPAVVGFIVLSGYCIHRNGFRRARADVAGYARRRAFRIVPVYVLGVAIGVAGFAASREIGGADAALQVSSTYEITLTLVIAKLSAIAAIVPPLYEPVFQGNGPLETVMVEMWLYLLYPVLLLLVVRRVGELPLWCLLGTVWSLCVLLVAAQPSLFGWWQNASVLGYLAYWWLGAKMIDPNVSRRIGRWWPHLFVIWITTSAALHYGAQGNILFVEARKLVFATLVGLAIARLDGFDHKILVLPAAVGRAGYSLYALHAPVVYTLLVAGIPWLIAIAITVALGVLTYLAYERPLMRLGRPSKPAISIEPLPSRA